MKRNTHSSVIFGVAIPARRNLSDMRRYFGDSSTLMPPVSIAEMAKSSGQCGDAPYNDEV